MKVGVWVFYCLKNLGGFAPSREKKQPGPRWGGKRLTQRHEDAKGSGNNRGSLGFLLPEKPWRLRAFA